VCAACASARCFLSIFFLLSLSPVWFKFLQFFIIIIIIFPRVRRYYNNIYTVIIAMYNFLKRARPASGGNPLSYEPRKCNWPRWKNDNGFTAHCAVAERNNL